MSLSLVGSDNAMTTVLTPSAHQAGDLFLAFAYREDNNTAPALPSGWTALANAGANTNSARVAYKIAAGSSEDCTGWTNATGLILHIYRSSLGAGRVRPGNFAAGGAASSTIAYNTLTEFIKTDGTSWVAGFAGHRSVDQDMSAPTGMTALEAGLSAACEIASHDTAAAVSSWSVQSVVGGGTSSGWRSYVVEIRELVTIDMIQSAQFTAAAGATTIALAFPENVTSGSLLLATVTWDTDTGATTTPTDTLSNTWALVSTEKWDSTQSQGEALYYTISGSGGANTVTGNFASSVGNRGIVIAEFQGIHATPLDQVGSNEAQTAVASVASSPSITPSEDGCLIVGGIMNTSAGTVAPGSGFFEAMDSATTFTGLQLQWQVQTTAIPVVSIWTTGGATNRYNSSIGSFKAAAAGAATSTSARGLATMGMGR